MCKMDNVNVLILRTNEVENAVDYLEKAAYHFRNREDCYWFKWLMISLHGALYGFGVCAIKGTSTDRVLELKLKASKFEQKKKDISEFYIKEYGVALEELVLEATTKYNVSQLLSIWDILKHCQDESYMLQYYETSKILKLSDTQIDAIGKMINYRNDFAHFKPKGISIVTQSEEWIIKEVISVIRFLALDSGNVLFYERNLREKTETLLEMFII
jgi:hypothetical protein